MSRKVTRKNMRSSNSRRLRASRSRSKRSLRSRSRRSSVRSARRNRSRSRSNRRRLRRMRGGEVTIVDAEKICKAAAGQQGRGTGDGACTTTACPAFNDCVEEMQVYSDKQTAMPHALGLFQ